MTGQQVHRTDVVDNERGVKKLGYRWECICRRHGQWTFSKVDAEKAGKAHEKRFQNKQAKRTPFRQGLQDLLNLG